MPSIVKWVVSNGAIAYLAYLGAIEGHAGWGRVFLLLLWMNIGIQALYAAYAKKLEWKQLENYKPPRVPRRVRSVFDVLLAAMLAYAGWIFTAVAVVAGVLLETAALDNTAARYEELKKQQESTEEHADGIKTD